MCKQYSFTNPVTAMIVLGCHSNAHMKLTVDYYTYCILLYTVFALIMRLSNSASKMNYKKS